MEHLLKYFPNITDKQRNQFAALQDLYSDWNSKINLISRKDIDNLYVHHVLHSLSIAKILSFRPGTTIMDIGCGGGFPSIPLAIMFPDSDFKLVDSIGKKLKVCDEIAKSINLTNITTCHERGEDEKGKFQFIVSRAVMQLPDLVKIVQKNLDIKTIKNSIPNGIICLKGGNLTDEIAPFHKKAQIFELSDWFDEEFFETKKAVYLPY